ncbi:MAG: T9SS type A sorting domain-containing protein [bacterium]|nr:T9SS type A sorting domain-containing protein [bacterium]
MSKAGVSRTVVTTWLGLALLVPALSQAAWPADPTVNAPVCTAAGTQEGAVMAPVATGGTVIAWRDYRAFPQQMYAQRLAADGTPLWGTNGVALGNFFGSLTYPAIFSDNIGGAIVVWLDWRETNPAFYAQRIGNDGSILWTPGGVRLAVANSSYPDCALISDGSGGAIAVWRDLRNGGTSLVAQRIPFSGIPQWGADGAVLHTSFGDMGFPAVATDVVGGAVVVWHEDPVGDPFNLNFDLYAMHVQSNGFIVWGAGDGAPVCSAAGDQMQPVIVSDAAGGVVVAWQDSRNGGQDLYAQRVQPWGEVAWAGDGVAVSTAVNDQVDPSITTDGAAGAIVAWRDRRSGDFDIYAQSLDTYGNARWTTDGLALVQETGNQIFPVVAPDLAGGAIVAWTDMRTGVDVYARQVSANGVVRGPAGGVAIGTAANTQDQTKIATDNAGGAVVAWRDNRTGSADIYAQRLSARGALGSEPVIANVQDVPNDQGGRLKLSWYASDLDASPAYGIGSYWIWRSVPPNYAAAALERGAPLLDAEAKSAPVAGLTLTSTVEGDKTIFWEYVGSQFAAADEGYSYVVPTTSDSLPSSNPLTLVRVQARAAVGAGFWNSPSGSGYSVDNLAPPQPAAFTGNTAGGNTALHWLPVAVPDLAGYRLYRGATAAFVPGPGNLVAAQADTGYVDATAGAHYYKLCAEDIHGNQGPFAVLAPQYTSGVDGRLPGVAVLSQNAPNPFNPRTTIRFTLPGDGVARLAIYDLAGRLVRTLVAGSLAAGEHEAVWDGCDDAGRAQASGSYLARLEAGSGVRTVRMALVR